MGKKLTTETFKIQLEKEHPNLELLSEYNGNKNYGNYIPVDTE